jgi:DNA-binding transcriptional MerR regulator
MPMRAMLSIGDFSRMTYLSVKALRHYHEIGLLEPAAVDPGTGYRLYQPAQVGIAQVIRRLRDVGMPLDGVRAVLDAPDVEGRNAAIVAHLRRMERQLEQTQASVASLRALLDHPLPSPIRVECRTEPAIRAIAIREQVAMSDSATWWTGAFDELHGALARGSAVRAAPDGALYFSDFFQSGMGDVLAFIPIKGSAPQLDGRVRLATLPAREMAVTVHHGPFADLDRTYAALGTHVAERALGIDGPIRENYLITSEHDPDPTAHLTEVCWPIFQTTTGAS